MLNSAPLCSYNAGVDAWLQDPNIIHHLEYLDSNFPGRDDLDPKDNQIKPKRRMQYAAITVSVISGLSCIFDFLTTQTVAANWHIYLLSAHEEDYISRDGEGTAYMATGLLADLYTTLKKRNEEDTSPAAVSSLSTTETQQNRAESASQVSAVTTTTLPTSINSANN